MPPNQISAQLDRLDEYLRDLRETQPSTLQDYQDDKMLRRYTERILQMAAEVCIRIGIDVLTQEGLRDPENYHDVFIVLGEERIIPNDIVNSLTALVELGNLLAFEQASVDDLMVYGYVKKRLPELASFSQAMHARLQTTA